MYRHPGAVFGERPDGHTLVSIFKWLYLGSQTRRFCKAWSALGLKSGNVQDLRLMQSEIAIQ